MNEKERNELLKNDPFLKLWEDNYYRNITMGHFSEERTKPVMFLVNTRKYSNVPVVLVAAGPSLDKNICYLKDKQQNCIIVCADVVLFKLLENGIKPDFVVNVDPHESITRFFENLDTKDLTFVCPTTTNPKTIQSWKGRIFYYNQTDILGTPKGDTLKRITRSTEKWGSILNRYFVGATMLQFSTVFNPSQVILLGYDFAYTDGKAFCDGFLDIKIYHNEHPVGSEEHKNMIEILKAQEIHKDVEFHFPGKESIWTSHTLKFYKDTFFELATRLGVPITNSTEGGILKGFETIPLKNSLEKYCQGPIDKGDVFAIPKRKRKRRNK